jgi:pimeloyl-ACP methyl ester carboxylesterase
MRLTQIRNPVPDTDCNPEGLHPTNYERTPERFLVRRPESYWAYLLAECEERGTIEECERVVAPVEDQWAGRLSAFEEGLLIGLLREAARTATENPAEVLADAAASAADGDIELARALADLAVTGQAAFELFREMPPSVSMIAGLLSHNRPALVEEARLSVAEWALDRAFAVATALRTGFNRSSLGWIAVSAPDDPPHRPVNVPRTRYPQFDLYVPVRGWTYPERVVRTRAIIASGEPPTPTATAGRAVPADPMPHIGPDERLIVFIHGHSSRLEECESLLHPLVRRGFTVVAMDLPSCGYAEMIPHQEIDPDPPADRPTDRPRIFPILDFLEQFVVDFVRALGDQVGRDISSQVSAVIGGSLGGNLSLRLATRDPLVEPCVANLVPWSAASVWMPASGLREAGATTTAERAWEPESEDSRSRRMYFYHVFYHSLREYSLRPQPEYWYRDGWEPCKTRLITGALADRQETYNPVYRRWHWRAAMEQLYFSHREPRHQSAQILGRILLTSGTGDNYDWTNIHDATRELAVELINPPGRLLSLDNTGHSIYIEHPEVLARHIATFVPPLRPVDGREEIWTDWMSLGGSSTSDPTVGIQEDGRLDVFTLNRDSRVQHITQTRPGGGWGSWTNMDRGLDDDDRFLKGIAVGTNQDGRLEVFATLADHNWLAHVWQSEANGAWENWAKGDAISQLIGRATSGVTLAERVGDGPSRLLLAIACRDNDRIHVRGQNRLGSWWMSGFDLGQEEVRFVGKPAAALNQARLLQIFARDSSGELWRIWETEPDTWAERWTGVGPVASDPAVALDAGGRLRVFSQGPDGDLLTRGEDVPASSSRSPGGSWGSWRSLGGELDTDARPAVLRNAWGELQVFARWRDGSIRSRRQLASDGTRWSDWLQLGGDTDRNPAVAMNPDGTISIFYVGRDGELYASRQKNPHEEELLDRAVTATRKDPDGDILALCNEGATWSPRAKADAIRDIETGAYTYHVRGEGGRTGIHVVDGPSGKYLRTDPDATGCNNLEELPDC